MMIKPDGVQRNLIAPILDRFLAKARRPAGLWLLREQCSGRWACRKLAASRRLTFAPVLRCVLILIWTLCPLLQGFTLRGLKFMNVTKQHAETHYADLSSKPFFGGAWPCWGGAVAGQPVKRRTEGWLQMCGMQPVGTLDLPVLLANTLPCTAPA